MRPSFMPAATISRSPCLNTVGPVANAAFDCVNQSFSWSVLASSATMAFVLPSPVAVPEPTAAKSVPSVANATRPTIGPPLLFHDATGLPSLSRSIAQTAFGAPPQLPEVVAYSVVFTAMVSVHVALAGMNSAGFCMSFPDGRPRTCRMPSLESA